MCVDWRKRTGCHCAWILANCQTENWDFFQLNIEPKTQIRLREASIVLVNNHPRTVSRRATYFTFPLTKHVYFNYTISSDWITECDYFCNIGRSSAISYEPGVVTILQEEHAYPKTWKSIQSPCGRWSKPRCYWFRVWPGFFQNCFWGGWVMWAPGK